MLDTETKRRIDTARDILVGKVPDPKSQVEQITIALIYKFMDDMDAEAEELGGHRKFFSGDYGRYGWARLMRSGLGGHETLALYAEAIARMPENPGIPLLFRDIFKNAYLPYRDPETLKGFLKIIDEFQYDHSERLGDAFEYLLSVLGSQGDAGQFRTPRHIIDFMVAVIDPRKNETVLDPACGTAGFLISAYKHILRANSTPSPSRPSGPSQNTLTPDERGRLAQNFKGYDISPDMVRLSLVNLYLHGFTDPHIYEYDTLTSQDRWNDYADVILANPPFMSPKGGIKPHNRFGVQSKRSEVLFVDYMAEHLTPGGRAAIIVPEGIIFQSQTAYTQLRRMLLEDYLVAVISLPAGVFQPYSGVKTSILILDKSLAKRAPTIAFFKVENDGFGLGAQRRPIEKNDLPQVQAALAQYLQTLRSGAPIVGHDGLDGQNGLPFQNVQNGQTTSEPTPSPSTSSITSIPSISSLIVPKEKIAANGDYNLSGERYREGAASNHRFPQVELGTICKPEYGFTASAEDKGDARFVRITDISPEGRIRKDEAKFISLTSESEPYLLKAGDILVARTGATFGKTMLFDEQYPAVFASYLIRLRFPRETLLPEFYWAFAQSGKYWEQARNLATGGGQPQFNGNALIQIKIPLPPLSIQKEIVAEISAYQKVIDGARAVLDNYRPHIPIDPKWPMEVFGEVTSTITPPAKIQAGDFSDIGLYPVIDQSQNPIAGRIDDESALVDGSNGLVIFGDHTCAVKFVRERFAQGADGIKIIQAGERLEPEFVYFYLLSYPIEQDGYKRHFGKLKESSIPVPPLATQQAIVAEIEAEQALVNANRDLIARMEKKIQATLARVWGESP